MKAMTWMVVGVVAASTGCAGSAGWSARGPGGGGGDAGRAGGGTHAPAAVAIPDLTLMTRAEAEAALKQAGFTAAPELDAFACGSTLDDKRVVELGRVCYQTPSPGRQASTAIPVKLRVQNENPWRGEYRAGRSWFLMPDFAGTDVEVAKAKMRELGFIAKEVKISYVVEPGCKPSTVCRTTPEAWSRADSSSDKMFIVGQPPQQAGAGGTTAKPPAATDGSKPKDPAATTPPVTTKPADIF